MKGKRSILLNYPLIWSTKFHYILFVSIAITILLVEYEFREKFQLYELFYMYTYLPYILLPLFIYWLYRQKFYIQSKNYGKLITNPFIEFQIYFFSILFFFLPFLFILSIFYNLTNQYSFTKEELRIEYFTFENNKYIATCHDSSDNYSLSELGEEICIGDKELFDKVFFSLTQTDVSDKVNVHQLDNVKEKLHFIDSRNSQKLILFFSIQLIIFFTIWLILFKIMGVKKSIYILVSVFIYYIIIFFLSEGVLEILKLFKFFLNINDIIPIIITVFFIELFFTLLLFILHKFYIKKSLIIFLLLINSIIMIPLILSNLIQIDFFTLLFLNRLVTFIPFFILVSIFIKPVVNYVIYLESRPVK